MKCCADCKAVCFACYEALKKQNLLGDFQHYQHLMLIATPRDYPRVREQFMMWLEDAAKEARAEEARQTEESIRRFYELANRLGG